MHDPPPLVPDQNTTVLEDSTREVDQGDALAERRTVTPGSRAFLALYLEDLEAGAEWSY
jgi:hypothetical protein